MGTSLRWCPAAISSHLLVRTCGGGAFSSPSTYGDVIAGPKSRSLLHRSMLSASKCGVASMAEVRASVMHVLAGPDSAHTILAWCRNALTHHGVEHTCHTYGNSS